LNSAYVDSYSYKVGDNLGHWLMAMRKIASINTQKISVSVTHTRSFVAQREASYGPLAILPSIEETGCPPIDPIGFA